MKKLLAAASCLIVAAPLSAQSGPAMISANDPAGIVRAMEAGGHTAELSEDGEGDPMIITELGGWSSRIYFYGCDDETHTGCDSVQLSTGFDRKEPWTPADAIALSGKYRFMSVRLDDEGDPYINWDINTGDGIPAKVFLSSVLSFTLAIENASNAIFAGQPGA